MIHSQRKLPIHISVASEVDIVSALGYLVPTPFAQTPIIMKKHLCFLLILCCQIPLCAQQQEFIRSIFFGGGSYYIDGKQANELREFIESMPDLKHFQISISSHTDNIGGVEYNQWLSEMRSEAVIEQLRQNNIPRDRVGRIDNGQLNPLYDNKTWNGRMANRRVDILFTPLFL